MIEAAEFKVVHLIRISFGNIELGDLKVGKYRHLDRGEVATSKKLVGMV